MRYSWTFIRIITADPFQSVLLAHFPCVGSAMARRALLSAAVSAVLVVAAASLPVWVPGEVGPGTNDGCEDAGWTRVGPYCYFIGTYEQASTPETRTFEEAEAFCTNLTEPRQFMVSR